MMCLTLVNKWFIFILFGSTIAQDAQIVENWAQQLGFELWDLANAVTRPDNLKTRYQELNARVENKSGHELVAIISESVGRMLRRKIDAVRCIRKEAEDVAEYFEEWETSNLTYVSGVCSNDSMYNVVEGPRKKNCAGEQFREIELEHDSHFYNIPVNTNYSSVHVPINIYDNDPEVRATIQWTEHLDSIFRRNYRSDPALSWQYFGSNVGILRQFPAMQWRTVNDTCDTYDCRMRSWYIEAATCSKDMVILLDVSGSMQGMSNAIAKATIGEILGSLSNNDFVTILSYTNLTNTVVPCFNRSLIQATPENIDSFNRYIANLSQAGNTNLTEAFERAFDILDGYRDLRGCSSENQCNQVIMLVTDGVPQNMTEVIRARNLFENGTYIPVRIFTYLLGKEVSKVREIQQMACLNRGWYSQIKTLGEVRGQVLNYVSVIARPLVLQAEAHPASWTHVYADISNPALATSLALSMEHPEQTSRLIEHLRRKQLGVGNSGDDIYVLQLGRDVDAQRDMSAWNVSAWQEYRLLTSVSIPAYDRKRNRRRKGEGRLARLLGVAGTDVPINEIQRLTLPYKLGVNGYAFIVSNNGYVILHPDLRPVSNGNIKRNYNSIDLTEVEILDDDRAARSPGPEVLDLRRKLVFHESGSILGLRVRYHYDDNRRVTLENRDYFFAPLNGTPFSLAVVLPDYGTHWIKVSDEIKKIQDLGIRILDLFDGNRWRVHPGWVYCRFHYLEGHEFTTPEEEARHFLEALDAPGWYWAEQYEKQSDTPDEEPVCGRQTLQDDDYYCNKELVQLLIFDARATNGTFTGNFDYANEDQRKLAKSYDVFLRFVGTQSGLTRWQPISSGEDEEEEENASEEHTTSRSKHKRPEVEFGDLYRRAVNEPWYKGAIFQHNVEADSILVTVPWAAGLDAIVTVSLGIFPKDGGEEAPAAVVGFQLPMTALHARFLDITSRTENPWLNCKDQWIDCYLVDQNGYVVISEAHNDTGHFLGNVEGPVMRSMIEQGLYKPVDIYDYQALCERKYIVGAAPGILVNPIRHLGQLLGWFVTQLFWFFSGLPEWQFGTWARRQIDEDTPDPPPPPHEETAYYSCDQKRTLYIVQQDVANIGITNMSGDCCRPFFAEKVPYTNLLLVVINTLYPSCYDRLFVIPEELTPTFYTGREDEGAPCHKRGLNFMERRPLNGCYADHPLEKEILECGGSHRIASSHLLTIFALMLLFFCTRQATTSYRDKDNDKSM